MPSVDASFVEAYILNNCGNIQRKMNKSEYDGVKDWLLQ